MLFTATRAVTFAVSALLGWAILCSGIRRHDVPQEKYIQLAAEPQFDCVGAVFAGRRMAGSCVLISDRYVLSAAHVFLDENAKKSADSRFHPARRISFRFNDQKVDAKTIVIHPGYSPSGAFGHCDLALIELAEPVTDVSVPRVNMHFDEAGSHVTGVGFGATGTADKPDKVTSPDMKIAGQNVVDSLTGDLQDGRPSLMAFDFDHPTRTDCNRTGAAMAQPLEYVSAGGDSGGGLFRQTGDGWELIGICAGGGVDVQTLMSTGYYGQLSQWMRVSVFKNWMDSVMEN